MNLPVIILAFKMWLMRIGLSALAAIAIGSGGVALWRAIRRPMAAVCRFPHLPDIAVMACLCVACIMYGGDKLRSGGVPSQPSVTVEEIAQGYRLESVVTNDAISYAMPTDGVENVRWSRRGGRETRFALDLGGFWFPYGTGEVHRVDVLSGGTVESLPRPSQAAICAAGEWASLIPGVSRFWWADAGSCQAKILTWENVFAGRDRTGVYSAQIELREGGDFTTRSNNVECVYRRVPPFDWDDDGLENSLDPDPLLAGPDAHGTNVEWYNAVCSNVLVAAEGPDGISLSWREGVNSNAYYFVDVVAERGPAPICFTGDRQSALGDPVVVARDGETNRVPLLIGIDYTVTSTVPFVVSVPSEYMYPVAETNGTCEAHVRWPLGFEFTEGFADGSRGYTVDVVPYDPGGVFSWELPRRGAACGCVSYSGRTIVMGCTSTCECGGGCAATGAYMLESAIFAVTGGVCRCGFDDPESPGEPSPSPEFASFSVSFSKRAVIFEDAYEASPGNWKPKRSNRVRLTVSASGGPRGGTLELSSENLGKLSAVGGGSINLPQSLDLDAGETFYTTCVYEGGEASASEDDVTVSGTFTETGTGEHISDSNSITVVRVELQSDHEAPQNDRLHRHDYGIGEKILLLQIPTSPAIDIYATDATILGSGTRTIAWGVSNVEHKLSFSLRGAEYIPLVTVLTPTGIEGYDAQARTNGLPVGVAGGLWLVQRYKVLPLRVDFSGLKIEEVPCDEEIPPTGYFIYTPTNTFPRSHTRAAKAGNWVEVDQGNYIGVSDDARDKAGYLGELSRMMPDGTMTTNTAYGWLGGTLTWKIPFGWKSKEDLQSEDPVDTFAEDTRQIMAITSTGDFSIQKLRHSAIRQIDGPVSVDGHDDDGILDN